MSEPKPISVTLDEMALKAFEGDLRVYWIPQVPMQAFHHEVKSPKEAKLILDALAQYDLFLLEYELREDFSNAGGLVVFEDGEWVDWESEDGESISEWSPIKLWRCPECKAQRQVDSERAEVECACGEPMEIVEGVL